MKLNYFYHRDSDLVSKKEEFSLDYFEIINTLQEITDGDLINAFKVRKEQRENIKSLSEPINFLIKRVLKILIKN